jgi:nicotinamidase-related amidase
MKQDALLIVDIQNDYFAGGKMELDGMEAAATNAQRVLKYFRAKKKPVFHIQHIANRPGAAFFLPDTVGAEIHHTVTPETGEPVIQKHFPNSFRDTSLQAQLNALGIEQLTICGAMSHMCIDTTVRAAFDLGFGCRVVSDACATRKMEFGGVAVEAYQVQAAFMAALAVPFAQIVETEGIIDEH